MFKHEIATSATTDVDGIRGMAKSSAVRCTCGRSITGKGSTAVANFEKHVRHEAEKAERLGDDYRPMYADRPWNWSVRVAPVGDDRKGSVRRRSVQADDADEAVARVQADLDHGMRVVGAFCRTRVK